MSSSAGNEILKVISTRFGEFDVNASSVITIPSGLIGFPGFSQFIILEYNQPFSWLHSLERSDLAFVVVNAAEFGDGYIFDLPLGDSDTDLREEDDVAVINLVSVRPAPQETTVNLKAPVVVNLRNMRGRQVVLDDHRFSMRFSLWAANEPQGEAKIAEPEKK